MIYDLVIIGGGPAGAAAAVYAARKRLKTVIITESFGGQSVVSTEIQNWIGTPAISGEGLAKQLEVHVKQYAGEFLTIETGARVATVNKNSDHFTITTESNKNFSTKTVLVATGSSRKKLVVPGADTYDQKGLTYCASCDGPLFADQDVVVVGGGNAGFESAGQLLAYAKSVTLLHKNPDFKADKITVEKLLQDPKFKTVTNVEILEVKGDQFVTGIVYKDKATGQVTELPTTGIFVEIGFVPATGFVKDLVKLNEFGAIIIDPRTGATSQPGIWAAGDCTDGLYHQNNIAAGDAVKALEDIYNWLKLK